MAWICLAPEYGVAVAMKQYLAAYIALRKAQREWGSEAKMCTMAHVYCTEMGGIAIRKFIPPSGHEPDKIPQIPDQGAGHEEDLDYFVWSLEQLCASRATPAITEQDINDKSKSDALTKAFALVQCSWLVIQLIARVIQGLAITELELSTAAFVFCSLIMYIQDSSYTFTIAPLFNVVHWNCLQPFAALAREYILGAFIAGVESETDLPTTNLCDHRLDNLTTELFPIPQWPLSTSKTHYGSDHQPTRSHRQRPAASSQFQLLHMLPRESRNRIYLFLRCGREERPRIICRKPNRHRGFWE
ncbi:hypothetical protein B0H67DRAFT_587356 [Lasiosphaeris hirsuta]|uniref:Uncharacterized protein n=1 Tax=Lasiosphaeris hirsuta TaxID=260670 RepID=A0AA40DPI3_9PEZI|nr:hypothetical protein B0H67DRAFT_587356 [Lasiosphaeris hirsuta]